jgi:hypothetical protein
MVSVLLACKATPTPGKAPEAPAMPAHWKVTSDISLGEAEVKRISAKLGGQMVALRNTSYEVDGRKVKLNTLVAATAADGDKLYNSLKKIKPEDFLLRKGLTIYEFVGSNDAIPAMRAGRARIQSQTN